MIKWQRCIILMAIIIWTPPIFGVSTYFPDSWTFSPTIVDKTNTVFQNPASLNADPGSAIQVQGMNTVFDYTYYSLAYTTAIDGYSVGMGLESQGASDIKESTQTDPITGRPVQTGTLSDTYQVTTVAVSRAIDKSLSVGIRANYWQHKLYTASATAFSGTIGLAWVPDEQWQWGVYANNVVSTPLTWDTSGKTKESLPTTVVLEGHYKQEAYTLSAATDGTMSLVGLNSKVAPSFSIFGSLYFQSTTMDHYAVGTQLQLGQMAVQYSFIQFLSSDLSGINNMQHLLGLSFKWL